MLFKNNCALRNCFLIDKDLIYNKDIKTQRHQDILEIKIKRNYSRKLLIRKENIIYKLNINQTIHNI
jgi:hypothetical protein